MSRFHWLAYFARDLLACLGLYAALAALGHPGIGGGVAFLGACCAVGDRIPWDYSPGDAGSVDPRNW